MRCENPPTLLDTAQRLICYARIGRGGFMRRFFSVFSFACLALLPSNAQAQSPRCDVFFQSVTGEICARSVTVSAGYFNSHDRFRSSRPIGFGSIDTTDARRQAGGFASIGWAPFDRFEVGVGGSLRNQTIGDASIFNAPGFPFIFGSTQQTAHGLTSASAFARYEILKGDALGGSHIVTVAGQVENDFSYKSSVYLLGAPPTLLRVQSVKNDFQATASLRTSHTWDVGNGFSITARTLSDVTNHSQSNSESLRVVGRLVAAYVPFGLAIGPEYILTSTFGSPSSDKTYHFAGVRMYLSPSRLIKLSALSPLVIEASAHRIFAEDQGRSRRVSSGAGFFMQNHSRAATDFNLALRYRFEY